MGLNKQVPWYLHKAWQTVLVCLPLRYSFWKRVALLEHGDINHPPRSVETYSMHTKTSGGLPDPLKCAREGSAVLELVQGESLDTELITSAHGAARVWL